MTAKSLFVYGGLLLTLSACGYTPRGYGTIYTGLAVTTPPLNTIIFGPCNDEFGMPDSRKADCELHYHIMGQDAPWEARAKYVNATAYQPGELTCERSRGKVVDCAVASGLPHSPPYIAAPNNLGSE